MTGLMEGSDAAPLPSNYISRGAVLPQDLANVDDDVHVVDGVELANVSAEAPAC